MATVEGNLRVACRANKAEKGKGAGGIRASDRHMGEDVLAAIAMFPASVAVPRFRKHRDVGERREA